MHSPLNYLGGKSRLARKIIPLIPQDHLCYCEPFCGAAWVFFGKEPSRAEILNDMDGELVCSRIRRTSTFVLLRKDTRLRTKHGRSLIGN